MGFDVQHQVPVQGYGQYLATTCWHAAYRMLHAWKGADENGIGAALAKAKLDLLQLRQRGLYPEELPTACFALGLVGWRGDWVCEQDDGMFAHLLKGYGPLWVATEWQGKAGNGHAVVIVGYRASDGVFKVHNPYNRFEPGVVELEWLKGDQLRKWIVKERCALQAWP